MPFAMQEDETTKFGLDTICVFFEFSTLQIHFVGLLKRSLMVFNYPPLLGHTSISFFVRQGSKICIRARHSPPRTLQTETHRQIRRLRPANPMEGVPDQDSAKNQ